MQLGERIRIPTADDFLLDTIIVDPTLRLFMTRADVGRAATRRKRVIGQKPQ